MHRILGINGCNTYLLDLEERFFFYQTQIGPRTIQLEVHFAWHTTSGNRHGMQLTGSCASVMRSNVQRAMLLSPCLAALHSIFPVDGLYPKQLELENARWERGLIPRQVVGDDDHDARWKRLGTNPFGFLFSIACLPCPSPSSKG